MAFLAVQCGNKDKQQAAAAVSETEWTILFDGSGTDQWRDTESEQFPEHGWMVGRSMELPDTPWLILRYEAGVWAYTPHEGP